MSAGQTIGKFGALSNEPPAASYATLDQRNSQWCLDFDAAADESAIFSDVMPSNYAGGGISVILVWSATSATSGSCRWSAEFERQQDETDDTDSDSFATAQTTGGTAPGTSGTRQYTTIAFTSGQIDGIVAGERYRLRITRDADGTSGTDDMTGDAELVNVELREA